MMRHDFEYDYEQELEDGSFVNRTLIYEVEPPSRGGRDEPPSGGCASIYEIRHADGSRLPDDSWIAAGFDPERIRQLEERCYESWSDAMSCAYQEEQERRAECRREEIR